MRADYIILNIRDPWQIPLFILLSALFLISGFILLNYGINLLLSGIWYLILFDLLVLSVTIGSFLSLIFFSRYQIIIDDVWIEKIGFSNKQISFSELDQVQVHPSRITLISGKLQISIGTWHDNYLEAMDHIKERIQNRPEVTITGKKRYLEKHFGENLR